VRCTFDQVVLGAQWQWNANHRDEWASLAARPGHLRLLARPLPAGDLAQAPHLLLQKLPARAFAVETVVELAGAAAGVRAGLVVLGKTHAALAVEGERVTLLVDNRPVFSEAAPRGPVRLELSMEDGGLCRFAYQAAGAPVRRLPTVFQATEGVWVGARVGLFAAGEGAADFDYFRFRAPE